MQKRKEQLMLTFLKMIGSDASLKKYIELSKQVFKQKYPDIKSNEFDNVYIQYGEKELFNRLLVVYDAYFSEEEIQEMIAFFSSPIGKKMRDKAIADPVEKIQVNWVIDLESQLAALSANILNRNGHIAGKE